MVLGKTIFISILSRIVKAKKILVIDFDLVNNNLYTMYGVNSMPRSMKDKLKDDEYLSEFRLNERNIEKLLVKVSHKIDLISSVKYVFDENYILKHEKIEEMIEKLKEKYDLILIDTTSDMRYQKLMEELINISSKTICLVEGNLVCMKKTKELLETNRENTKKINIIYNKKNKYTIEENVLKMVFFKYKFIGMLSYDCKYDKIINKNLNALYITSNIEKEFTKIANKLT
ncbi:MAG: AAA family ATPase [Clostridia bacterium]|nr:AAA family ATPase [Clostridia bacterium]